MKLSMVKELEGVFTKLIKCDTSVYLALLISDWADNIFSISENIEKERKNIASKYSDTSEGTITKKENLEKFVKEFYSYLSKEIIFNIKKIPLKQLEQSSVKLSAIDIKKLLVAGILYYDYEEESDEFDSNKE